MENRSEFSRYRLLLPIPIILLVFSLVALVGGYAQTGEWFLRSVEFKGGTLITLNNPGQADLTSLENSLSQFGPVSVREFTGISGSFISIEMSSEVDENAVLQELESLGFSTKQSLVQKTGPALSSVFWAQTQVAVIGAFILMSIIVFVIFRSPVPSIAVILAAASDIIVTLAIMQVLNIELSFASLAAIMTLIGYSVDTDVLLTTRVLRGEGMLRNRTMGALRTGMTMSLTAIGALSAIIIVSISQVLSQIAVVLVIGLLVDMANTWIQNASMLVWHAERRGIGNA